MPFDFEKFGSTASKGTVENDATAAPAAKAGSFDFSAFGSGEKPEKKPVEKKKGVVQSVVQAIANPFLKVAASGGALLEAGNKENFDKIQKEGLDFGYFGKATPVGAGFDVTKGVKENARPLMDAAGTGLEIASYVAPLGKAKTAYTAAKGGKVAQGAVQGAIAGAEGGALAGAGSGMREEDASLGSVLKDTTVGTLAGGALGGGLGALGGKASKTVSDVAASRSPEAIAKKTDDLVGAIVQGKKADIAKSKQALSNIELDGIKTYDELAGRANEQVETIANKLDETLGTDTRVMKLKDLAMETKVGDQSIRHNYVEDALNHLDELYSKTNDPVGLAKVRQLKARAKQTGLTIQEVNRLAIEHGKEFGSKAFSKASGDPLTSVNAQSFENTRKGLKATARDRFDNEIFKAADDEMSKLINLRSLAKDMAESVNKLQQKIKNRSFGQKLGGLVARAADFASGGTLKGAASYFLPRGEGLKVLNALDLEKALAKNLKRFQALAEQDLPEATIIEELEKVLNLRTAPTIKAPGGFDDGPLPALKPKKRLPAKPTKLKR